MLRPPLSVVASVGSNSSRWEAFTLRSAYQPIYSLSHQRLVGHEALLRALDAGGRSVFPADMFAACTSVQQLRSLDDACRATHARGFAAARESAQWLFLNVDASLFSPDSRLGPVEAMKKTLAATDLMPHEVVVELLEGALPDNPDFERWTRELKESGFLIALDDFGAGHSNFDRVFRVQPNIVKLDRSVIARAGADRTVRRVTTQMISLLHECGALVLVEGVETTHEAAIALDADADFVQGYHFGRPEATMRSVEAPNEALRDVWDSCDARAALERIAYAKRVSPYVEALELARRMMESGHSLEAACAPFLALPDAELCYLLDENGEQIGRNLYGAGRVLSAPANQFAPLANPSRARWSRRPYFRRAVAAPGQLQMTRPYPTMQSHRICTTLSVCFHSGDTKVIVCGDMLWRPTDVRPDFGATTSGALL
jgi:EAL domain-containing protein (putative c-di-GMP-specific phosphodiesterase class I)